MKKPTISKRETWMRIAVAAGFLAIGLVIVLGFNPWRPGLKGSTDIIVRLCLMAVLLAIALWARKKERLERFWQLLFALFVMITFFSLDLWTSGWMVDWLHLPSGTPMGEGIQKMKAGLLAILLVVGATLLTQQPLGSVYLQKGKWKQGLIIGAIAFTLAVLASIPIANSLFKAQNLTLAKAGYLLPGLILFVFGTAISEELIFRAIFLRKLEPFFGKFLANALVTIIFIPPHLGVTYSADVILFGLLLIPLSLAWGYIMQKTVSVWGSILFHAGMDIPIMLGIFSAM